jgi:amino acid adenylation domain-containing protein
MTGHDGASQARLAVEWVRKLSGMGVELWYEGDRLRFRAPKGVLGPEDRAELAARRSEIVAQLRSEASASERTFPLSYSQKSLWFLHQQAPESTAYHVALSARVLSSVDEGALRQALQALVDRHAILRTTYAFQGDAPCQRVAGAATVPFEVHAVPGVPDPTLRAVVEADLRRPFDLERGPVLRASLYTRGAEDHVLLITVHHIAADGWSLMMLMGELLKLYEEATGGAQAGLPRPTLQYTDYAAWQERLLAGPEGERLWNYWREKLTPLPPPLVLPADRNRPGNQTFRGASLPLQIGSEPTRRLKELARQEGTTAFVVLLASFQALLYRLTGEEDILVGTPTFARSRPEFMTVVGDFVNSVPLRARVGPSTTFRALVAQLRDTVLQALDAQEFPFPLLVQRLQPERNSGRSPIFDAFFVLQRFDQVKGFQELITGDGTESPIEAGGLRLSSYPVPQQEGQFDLDLRAGERGGLLHGVFNYSTDLFDEATIRGVAGDFLSLVDAVGRDPDVALGALPEPTRRSDAGPESVPSFLARLRAQDIRLHAEGGRLRVNAPKGSLDDALKAAIAERRDEILAVLRADAGTAGHADGPRRIPRGLPLPMSALQRRLWFQDRMDPEHLACNAGGSVRFRGLLDVGLLRQSLDELERRHESFRTRIEENDGIPVVQILEFAGVRLQLIDLGTLPADQRLAEALRLAEELIRAPLDGARGPLAAYQLTRLAPDDHIFTISVHHLVFDGGSMVVVLRDLCQVYEALAAGHSSPLEPLTLQAVDHAAWEQARLHSGGLDRQLAYWKRALAGAPGVLELPTDRARPATPSHRRHRVRRFLDPLLLEALERVGRRHESTLFVTLMAAFQVLLHRHSGQDDLVVGTPVANRDHPSTEGLVGRFVDDLPIRARLAGNPPFSDFLAQVKQTTIGALEHRDLPFAVLVDALQLDRSTTTAPVFQVLFTFHASPSDLPGPAGLRIEPLDRPGPGVSRVDLSLDIAEQDGRLVARYEYVTDLFDEATIVRMHGQLDRLLSAIVAAPSTPVEELPLLDAEHERFLLTAGADTALEHDRGRCVHHLLEGSARATPDATAVIAGDSRFTYREIDERANRLAHLLVRRGVSPGSLVAVCVDRTWDMPIAVAAVLKAGAAYVPLDPTHPADRLRFTLEDARVACAITLGRFAPLLADGGIPMVLLDEVEAELAGLPATPPVVVVRPEDRAYVIYTSGSTGRPKGVEVEHRNVVSFLEAMQLEPGLGQQDVLLAVTTLSFDIAGLELWLPFSVGACVVIASRAETLDGERLLALIQAHGVTVLQATPATWRLLLDTGWAGTPGLKALCGGEALPRDLAAAVTVRVGELWNMYGPTETTIWSTVCRVDDAAGPITIGHPIRNTRIFVLERSGQLAPIGVAGELCIGGEGVARGYRNRPELTAEKFVSVTLPGGRVERIYRTGDVARFRDDGRIDFLGRRDHQVKVRGYRIELGEIEAVLAGHPGVKECVVAVREDRPGDQRLVGYVVPETGATLDHEAARATLRTKLPEYMVPNLFVILGALPLTPNGKVDRKALPAPAAAGATGTVPGPADPLMSPVERRVAAAWREVLRADRVGLHDNFFDAGGHSLLLVKLHASLRREFGVDLGLVELFQWTTVAAQAARLSTSPAADVALRRAQDRAARQTRG